MNLSKADFWENKWLEQNTQWDLGKASPAICNFINQYKNKDAGILIPGCGNAYEAIYLLESGFKNITLIDISPTVVAILKERFKGNNAINIVCEDFFEHKFTYDLILEQTFFCAIDPDLRLKYAEKMYQLLNIDGYLAGLLFNRNFETNYPPYGGNLAEYQNLFKPYFIIEEMENCNLSIPARKNTELFIKLKKKIKNV